MRTLLVIAVALAAGCVKKSTHQKTVAELEAARATIAERDRKIAGLEGDLGKTRGDLDTARGEYAATAADLAELKEKRDADQKRLAAYRELQERFASLVATGDLEVAYRRGQMTLKLPSGVLFPSGSADLSDKGKKTLEKVTKALLDFKDRRFLIAGHTDNVPIKTEQFANNWYLSSARAIAVLQFMVEQGFPAKQLAAAGFADKDPVRKNKTKKGRAKNRRIEIILVPDLSDLPELTREVDPDEPDAADDE